MCCDGKITGGKLNIHIGGEREGRFVAQVLCSRVKLVMASHYNAGN